MKVTIEHKKEDVGMIFSKMVPAIRLTLEFSEREKEIIKAKQLEEYEFHHAPIYSYLEERMQVGEIIKHYLKTPSRRILYDTIAQAEADDYRLRENLKKLKQLLDQFATSPQSGTYEL